MKKVKDLLFFLPFYAYGGLGDVVHSSIGARGEQGGVARGAVRKNPPESKNPHAEQSRTGIIYKSIGSRWPVPVPYRLHPGRGQAAADPLREDG